MKKRQSQHSKEFVEAYVFSDTNPTGLAVSFAFPLVDGSPSTLVSGQWDPTGWVDGRAIAQCLVGPGAEDLAVGSYDVYVKWTDSPEVPLILTGQLEIY